MRELKAQDSRSTIREIRTTEDPAVQRLVASAMTLSETVGRLASGRAGR